MQCVPESFRDEENGKSAISAHRRSRHGPPPAELSSNREEGCVMSKSRRSVVRALCCLLWIVPGVSRGQSLSFVDPAGQPAGAYLESTRAYVQVVDPGANQNGGMAEAVTVTLTTAVWSDQESLTLQETGPDTGVFAGSIALRSAGPIVLGNGIL